MTVGVKTKQAKSGKVAGKKAEAALRESEERYRALVETLPYGVQENDLSGAITYSNHAHAMMLGYESGGPTGRRIWDLPPDAGSQDELKRYFEYIVREEPRPLPYYCRNATVDGRLIDVQVDWSYKRDADGRLCGFVSIITDITERKRVEAEKSRLEAQLRQSQKMDAIGRVTGGIVHDLNNVMTSFKNLIALGEADAGDMEPFRSYFADLDSACRRASGFTEKLALFSRQSPADFKRVDVNSLIEGGLSSVFGNMIGERIVIDYRLGGELLPVRADRANVEQLLMNLVLNARDAVGDKGTITVRTENAVVERKKCLVCGKTCSGRFVKLSVEDTGAGMDEATKERIFEPFFTTKAPGKGTGLGLSVVYGIVESHGGCLDVRSEPGRGSVFSVYLPVYDVSGEAACVDASGGARVIAGGEAILIVEDDPLVRASTRMLLERNGYVVVEAGSVKDAKSALKARERVDLIFCDMVLPDGSGLEFCESIRKARPSIKLALFSGYSDYRATSREIVKSGIRFIQKPFEAQDLLKALGDALGKESVA